MDKEYTRTEILLAVIPRYARYNVVELLFLSGYLVGYLNGGVWPAALWVGFVVSAWWTVIMSTNAAYEYARDSVYRREVYIGDFLSGAVVLSLLAVLVHSESWQFSVMFLLAVVQHLRYTYFAIQWRLAEKEFKGDKEK